ncbi:MAG: DUF2157 domain-containing protein [Aggregatilineales bacterium]
MRRTPLHASATVNRLTVLADEGVLSLEAWERACAIAGHTPTVRDWRVMINRALLVVGIIFIIAGILFIGAYNATAPPPWVPLVGLQVAIVITTIATWFFGIEGLVGKMAMLVGSMLVGALLAVIGQEYQTGANAYEVFLIWAVLISGWVVYTRWGPLLLVWWVLMNLGLTAYWSQEWGWSNEPILLALIVLNAVGLAIWEYGNQREVEWLEARWIPRLMALVTMGMEVYFMLLFMFSGYVEGVLYAALPTYGILLALLLYGYTHVERDLFMLALGGLSVVIITTAGIVWIVNKANYGYNGDILSMGCLILPTAGSIILGETYWIISTINEISAQWEREE